MSDGTGLAEALLGLDGFRVLRVDEGADELVVTVETVAEVVGCGRCGVRAEAHDRKAIDIRDLTCFGRPAAAPLDQAPVALQRRRLRGQALAEGSHHVDAQAVLTPPSGSRGVSASGRGGRAVSTVAAADESSWRSARPPQKRTTQLARKF